MLMLCLLLDSDTRSIAWSCVLGTSVHCLVRPRRCVGWDERLPADMRTCHFPRLTGLAAQLHRTCRSTKVDAAINVVVHVSPGARGSDLKQKKVGALIIINAGFQPYAHEGTVLFCLCCLVSVSVFCLCCVVFV